MTKGEQYHNYWDEGNKNKYPWFKKGKCKRFGRKKWLKFLNKTNEKIH